MMLAQMASRIRRIQPVFVRMPTFGITAFISRHGRSFQMGRMSNPFHKLIVVVEGNGALEVDHQVIALAPNSVVRANALTAHRFVDEPATPMTLAALCVSPEAADAELRGVWPARGSADSIVEGGSSCSGPFLGSLFNRT